MNRELDIFVPPAREVVVPQPKLDPYKHSPRSQVIVVGHLFWRLWHFRKGRGDGLNGTRHIKRGIWLANKSAQSWLLRIMTRPVIAEQKCIYQDGKFESVQPPPSDPILIKSSFRRAWKENPDFYPKPPFKVKPLKSPWAVKPSRKVAFRFWLAWTWARIQKSFK